MRTVSRVRAATALAVVALSMTVACSDRETQVIGSNDPKTTSAAPTTTAPSAPATGTFVIDNPQPGAVVPKDGTAVSGKSGLAATDVLWTVYQGVASDNPSVQPSAKPCTVRSDGSFTCPQQYVGGDSDTGKRYDVLFVKADPSAVAEFQRYTASDPAARGYPGLPALPSGVVKLGSVTVTRG